MTLLLIMVEAGTYSVAILAAGSSHRFGEKDKLAASFRGEMLGVHVCKTLSALTFANRWVITASQGHPCQNAWEKAGFTISINPDAHRGMGTSVAMAAALAIRSNTERLLICLADMPLVTKKHFRALIAGSKAADADAITATRAGQNGNTTPPAIFGHGLFPELARADGDTGARALLHRAALITAPFATVIDIDTPETLRSIKYPEE